MAMAKLDPEHPRAPRMARLRPADRPRGLRACARARRGDPRPARRRGSAASARLRRGARAPRQREAGPVLARLPRLRRDGPRLELLAEGLRRHGRESRSRRSSRSRCPTTARRCAPTSPSASSMPKEGAPPWQLLVQRARRRARTSTASYAAAAARGLGPRPDGAAAARDRRAGGPPLQRPRAAAHLRAARRELGLARLPASPTWCRRRAGRSRTALRLLLGEPRLLSAAARRSASPRCSTTAASSRTRSASASPSRCSTRSTSCCAASRPRTTPRTASFCASRSPTTRTRSTARSSRYPAARLPALRRGAGHAARGRDLPALLLARRPLRAAARGRRALSRTRWTSATARGRSSSSSSA